MSAPGMTTAQRYQIDSNASGIASQLSSLRINAEQFDRWVAGFDDATLLAAPYSYTAAELADLRAFSVAVGAYGRLQGTGGELSPTDAAALVDIGTKFVGMTFVPAKGPM